MSAERPTVWVNCAVSLDGKLAYAGGRRARLSGPGDLVRVHRMRAAARAILVGVGTVVADDPSLRVDWGGLGSAPGPDPTRIVLDSTGRTPEGARVLDGSAPTLVATTKRCHRSFPSGVETFVAGRERVELDRLWPELVRRRLDPVMVEGGSEVLASVLRSREFDRLTVYVAPLLIGGRTAPSLLAGPESPDEAHAIPLEFVSSEREGAGTLLTYRPSGGTRR